MGRQWNEIISSLGGLTGGTISINANLSDIDALLTTLQADVADGITVSSGTVAANTRGNGLSNDPWVYIPNLTMSHPDLGNFVFDGYYRFNGNNQWGSPIPNYGNVAYLTRNQEGDEWVFRLMVHDETNDVEIEMAIAGSSTSDFPNQMDTAYGTLVSGSLTFNTEQRESYGVRVTNSVTISSLPDISGTVTANPTRATSGGTGPTTFTSVTYGTIAASNSNRKGLTIYNEGAGNLHVTLGTATTSTSSYTVKILPSVYYELPYNYTGLIGGIFATAGTARVTELT